MGSKPGMSLNTRNSPNLSFLIYRVEMIITLTQGFSSGFNKILTIKKLS